MPSKGKRDLLKDLFEPWVPQGFVSLHMIPSACILTILTPSTVSLHQSQDTCAIVFSSLSTDCISELLLCSFTTRKRFPCHRAVSFHHTHCPRTLFGPHALPTDSQRYERFQKSSLPVLIHRVCCPRSPRDG